MEFNTAISAGASAPAIYREALPLNPHQDQFAAIAQQIEQIKLELQARADREQDNALAKMRAQFALAASTEKTRETNAQRFEKDFEAFAAEMKANYDALAEENRQLKAEMVKAEAREAAAVAAAVAAAFAATRAAQEAHQKEMAQLKGDLKNLKKEFAEHKHIMARNAPVAIGYNRHGTALTYRYDGITYTEGPTS